MSPGEQPFNVQLFGYREIDEMPRQAVIQIGQRIFKFVVPPDASEVTAGVASRDTPGLGFNIIDAG